MPKFAPPLKGKVDLWRGGGGGGKSRGGRCREAFALVFLATLMVATLLRQIGYLKGQDFDSNEGDLHSMARVMATSRSGEGTAAFVKDSAAIALPAIATHPLPSTTTTSSSPPSSLSPSGITSAAHPLARDRDPSWGRIKALLGPPEGLLSSMATLSGTVFQPRCQTAGASGSADVRHGNVWDEVAEESRNDPRLAICVMIRNEENLLDEWIAFHWLQGVRKFIIYDDGSTDASPRLLNKYVSSKIVEYHRIQGGGRGTPSNRGEVGFQMEHLNECIKDVRATGGIDWIMLADVDEFSYAKDANLTLAQALGRYYRGEPCVTIFRTDFGSSSRTRRPKTGLVIENYVLSAPSYRERAPKKLIVSLSPRDPSKAITRVFSPHRSDRRTRGLTCAQDKARHLQMNQYLRSLEDYDLKIKTHWTRDGKYEEDPLGHFWERDRNDILDDSAPKRFSCRVRSLLAFWAQYPAGS